MNPHNPWTRIETHLQKQSFPGRLHCHYCFQRKYSQQTQPPTLQYLHSRTANSPAVKSANSSISNQSRPKTSSVATSMSVSYKTIDPSSLPNLPMPAKLSENPGSLADGVRKTRLESRAGNPVADLYETNNKICTVGLNAITSTLSKHSCSIT